MRGRDVAVLSEVKTRKPSVAGNASARICRYSTTLSLSAAVGCAIASKGPGIHSRIAPSSERKIASQAPCLTSNPISVNLRAPNN